MVTPAFVSVLIPVRNEERDIRACLEAVLRQEHPHASIEVIVVDGGSVDGTSDVAREVLAHSDVPWSVIDNPAGTTPSNLNAGLAAARGDVLCRVDARSLIGPHHIGRCAQLLADDPSRKVVGGGQRACARPGATLVGRGIARALNNRWATGLARYRRGSSAGWADTVYLGAFRTGDLRAVGGWALDLPTNQDFDLNQRLGGMSAVWFDPDLTVDYLPRESYAALAYQYFRFGRWKRKYWRLRGSQPSRRQLVLLLVPPCVLVAGLAAFWRRPLATVAAVLVAVTALDVSGVRTPAPVAERAASLFAVATIGASWWLGVCWPKADG